MDSLVPDGMSDAAMWAILIGAVLPVVVNFIVSATWPSWLKAVVNLAVCVVVGAGTAFFTGAYTGLGIPSAILLTFVTAIAVYSQFWKQVAPQWQRDYAKKVESDDAAAVADTPTAPSGGALG